MDFKKAVPSFILLSFFALATQSLSASADAAKFQQLDSHFSASVSWTSDPIDDMDLLHGVIQYRPDSQTPSCGPIRMVQIARVQLEDGRDYEWTLGEANRNRIKTQASSRLEPGYYIDHLASRCSPGKSCSPYFRDSWPNPDESRDGFKTSRGSQTASIADYPRGWDMFQSIRLEACAVCPVTNQSLGCVKWGAEWPSMGDRKISGPVVKKTPSATFKTALRNFHEFYSEF